MGAPSEAPPDPGVSGLWAKRSWFDEQAATAANKDKRATREVMRSDLWYQRAMSKARSVTVSSGAANMGLKRINFGDLQWERSYGPWTAYCQSKLADLMFALELGRRSASAGIPLVSNAAHPG